MPYFKDKTGGVHFLDNAAFKHMLPQGCVSITDEEAAVISTPPPPAPDELVRRQIAALESTITQRRQREAILGEDNGWLADADTKIKSLRAKLK